MPTICDLEQKEKKKKLNFICSEENIHTSIQCNPKGPRSDFVQALGWLDRKYKAQGFDV